MNRFLLSLLLLATRPAAAQDRPVTMPTRDVDVTYRVGLGERMVEQRLRFRASDGRRRVDTPTPGVYAIVDPRARTMAMVNDADRAVLDLATPPNAVPGGPAGNARFVRQGTDVVAGLPCTEWETTDTAGLPTLACFTDDGVMLRARRGTAVLAVAVRVAYGPIDPATLMVPPGYAHASPQGRP